MRGIITRQSPYGGNVSNSSPWPKSHAYILQRVQLIRGRNLLSDDSHTQFMSEHHDCTDDFTVGFVREHPDPCVVKHQRISVGEALEREERDAFDAEPIELHLYP